MKAMDSINAYRELASSDAALGYRQLIQFFRDLHAELERAQLAPRALHVGEMDVTYVPLVPKELADAKLKVLVMFVHADFRLELWLSGVNKAAQERWWTSFSKHGWEPSELSASGAGDFHMVRRLLDADPDFSAPESLSQKVLAGAQRLVHDVTSFIAAHDVDS